MTKRAEELAQPFYDAGRGSEADRREVKRLVMSILETYGREVREAAAKYAETNSSGGAFPMAVAATIRGMPLP